MGALGPRCWFNKENKNDHNTFIACVIIIIIHYHYHHCDRLAIPSQAPCQQVALEVSLAKDQVWYTPASTAGKKTSVGSEEWKLSYLGFSGTSLLECCPESLESRDPPGKQLQKMAWPEWSGWMQDQDLWRRSRIKLLKKKTSDIKGIFLKSSNIIFTLSHFGQAGFQWFKLQ